MTYEFHPETLKEMLQAATRVSLVVSVLALGTSCSRGSPAAISPASAAYSDGFEVVVFELNGDKPVNVRSVPLREAEQAIASGSHALIPGDATAIQQQLSTGKSGDSNVVVSVQPLDGGRQLVRVSFHESSRTFACEYAVEGARVHPVASEYRDLAKSKVVRYASE